MEESASNLFREVDKLFDDKSVNTHEFYYDTRMTQYCPIEDGYRSCYSDYQRINAIGTYVFMELDKKNRILNESDDERHLSYFIMWISHILYRRFEDNTFTLNSIYGKHLKNNFGNFNYWNLLHNKMYLANSNIAIMNILYLLFQQICDIIKLYQTEGVLGHEYVSKDLQIKIIYDYISKYIKSCRPYLELLDHLKTIYNNFIKTAKIKNAHREDVLKQLIELSSIEKPKYGHKLNSKGCKRIHQMLENNTSKLIQIGNSMLKEYDEKKKQNTPDLIEPQNMGYHYFYDDDLFDDDDDVDDAADTDDDTDDDDLGTPDDTKDDLSINTDNQNQNLDPKQGNSTGASENGIQMNDPSANSKSPSQGEAPGDKHDITPPKIEGSSTPLPIPMKQTQDDNSQQSHQTTDSHIPGGASSPSDSGSKGTGNIKDPQENKQGAAGGGIENGTDHQNDPNSNPLNSGTNQGNPNDGPADGKGDTDKGALNTCDGQDDKGGQVGGSNGDQGSQGGSGGLGGLGGSGDGPGSAPVGKGPQSTSGDPADTGQSFFRIALKGMDKLSNTFKFFEKHKKKITETKETINNLYNTSMSNIKTAYDNSRNFLNSIIDNISNQPEKVDMPSTLGGSQPGSNGTGGGLPTTNGPTPPQKDSPQTPPRTPHTSLSSSDPKDQPNVPQLSQGPPGNQSSDQNNQGGSKIPVANPVVKPENSVAKVKVNETTGIGDIYILKEYKQIVISIIFILIPITLAIMYKYLSSGWRKEMKRKKNMKKVMNTIGGKRPIQIIIKSGDTKKMTSPIIKPIRGGKKSLLSIYKLMQADPVPFINLFFLLIFFVYKRKLNYLEL
ncbi:CIR protein PIR protein [Plasmodium vinckei brucechwatti]|uniref:CIR protein PIR protein n=1 Tax=Plasmodium vinckei brucechwatti TaxID=119398 RepID=A0A6V7RST7_PLAVN|nr:CIR protein PIR protein [Plasmodium vinckei brucechwatti]